jgi:hypothetical protein
MNTNLIGFILAFVTSLFAVVYTSETYDAWDALLALMSIGICLQLRHDIRTDRAAIIIGRITLGIALLVILMVALNCFNPELFLRIEKIKWRIFDAELGIALGFAMLVAPFYPGK